MMLTLARVLVRNGAYGSFSVKRITVSDRFSSLSMMVTNGLYIGTLSPAGAVNEKITSSAVTGRPSWNFMPLRTVISSVTLSSHSAFSAAQGLASPSGPTRNRRSQISSVTQESAAPLIYSGLIAFTVSLAFKIMSFWAPLGLAASKVQKFFSPIPICSTMLLGSQIVLLYAELLCGKSIKTYGAP